MADGSVHCVVTSPPYWGLRKYAGIEEEVPLGLEPTPEQYIENMVAVFREVKRILRDDGIVWLNIGDSYSSDIKTGGRNDTDKMYPGSPNGLRPTGIIKLNTNLKPLDLVGIPWRLAIALQADGWYLRSDVIWSKPNPMPESVNGWRWERHKIKVGYSKTKRKKQETNYGPNFMLGDNYPFEQPEWRDCPGCPVCEPNDGLVLRKGAWRPTKAHEYVFLLAKSDHYFGDADAVREKYPQSTIERMKYPVADHDVSYDKRMDGWVTTKNRDERKLVDPNPAGRNLRTVWQIPTQPYSGAHFATFPQALVEPCIKAGTSEAGVCPECGSQWARVVDIGKVISTGGSKTGARASNLDVVSVVGQTPDNAYNTGIFQAHEHITNGFRPTCNCGHDISIPATVFDPFVGSGTTLLVARKLGRSGVGIDLSMPYLKLARERLSLNKLDDWKNGVGIYHRKI